MRFCRDKDGISSLYGGNFLADAFISPGLKAVKIYEGVSSHISQFENIGWEVPKQKIILLI